ncbi:MAG: hypothetical protein AABX45_00370 [Nanoarchaeota archaeon]
MPEDIIDQIRVIETIPSNWAGIYGSLNAPTELYKKGRVAENTRLHISQFYDIHKTIIGADDVPYEDARQIRKKKEGCIKPNINDILLRGKLFSSIVLDNAAFKTEDITIEDLKEILVQYIGRGYKGSLIVCSGFYNNNEFDNPERFYFDHFQSKSFFHKEIIPPHVVLEWNEGYGGKKEDLETMIKSFEKIGLRELQFVEEQ